MADIEFGTDGSVALTGNGIELARLLSLHLALWMASKKGLLVAPGMTRARCVRMVEGMSGDKYRDGDAGAVEALAWLEGKIILTRGNCSVKDAAAEART